MEIQCRNVHGESHPKSWLSFIKSDHLHCAADGGIIRFRHTACVWHIWSNLGPDVCKADLFPGVFSSGQDTPAKGRMGNFIED
jgi:hypothetical protein